MSDTDQTNRAERRVLSQHEVSEMLREHLGLPPDADLIWQTDGALLIVCNKEQEGDGGKSVTFKPDADGWWKNEAPKAKWRILGEPE